MTDREIVEWVAQAKMGDVLPVTWGRIAEAMHSEAGFRMPLDGESIEHYARAATPHARRVVDSETWRADA